MIKSFGKALVLVGGVLLVISSLGSLTTIGQYENEDLRSWERFDQDLSNRTRTVDSLILEAKRINNRYDAFSDQEKMIALYNVVIDRFTHNGGARHNLYTNWILYILGKVFEPLGVIMEPEVFVAKGHSLICSQSSYLLMTMAIKEGINARHVGLNGHVVMEAWYENEWHMFDPDMEVIPKNIDGVILSVEQLSVDMTLLSQIYSGEKNNVVEIVSTRNDNTFMSYPQGAYFEWKTQVILNIEKLCQVLKYIIPLLLIFTGIFINYTHNKRAREKGKEREERKGTGE